jgi:hypothetical protein
MTASELNLEQRGLGHLEVRSDTLSGSLTPVEVASPGYDEAGSPCIVLNDTAVYTASATRCSAH